MNRITFTLSVDSHGPAVADLQAGLRFLIDKGFFGDSSVPGLDAEAVKSVYGSVTKSLVDTFQKISGLETNGTVDETTANVLNRELAKLGAFDQVTQDQQRLVAGQVSNQAGLALTGIRVRAFHSQDSSKLRLGEDSTDAEGRYTIRYEPLPGDTVNLSVAAIGDDGRILLSSSIISGARAFEIVNLTLPAQPLGATRNLVGSATLEDGRPVDHITLRLYRRDFGGGSTLLAETTAVSGAYAFTFNSDSANASLQISAMHPAGKEVPLDAQLNYLDGAASVTRNLLVPGDFVATPEPEFRRMAADLLPIVGDMATLASARETAERQDLTVLNRGTGWDARLPALAAQAARLSGGDQTPLSLEAFYGLLRAGLPSDKLLLAQVSPDAVVSALQAMRQAGIIGLQDAEINTFKEKFVNFSITARSSLPVPGGNATYGAMLDAAELNLSQKTRTVFPDIYFNHTGDDAQLWKKARKKGLPEQDIAQLQFQGKLSFLTGGSLDMINWLMRKEDSGARAASRLRDPAQLADLGLYTAERWDAELDAANAAMGKSVGELIPAAYTGTLEQRRTTYSQDMARKVNRGYPGQVLAHKIHTDTADAFDLGQARGPAAKLLRNAAGQGFQLGQTPVQAFLATHPGAADGLTPAEFAAAQVALSDLHCTYQISTSDAVMLKMRQAGLKRAYDVTSMSLDDFVAYHGNLFNTRKEAELVYLKAGQVSSMIYNLFTIANRLESDVVVYGASAPAHVQQSVKNELIKHYPTLETLFGSMDFCDCAHCRSVLSPAAYLVDLLQYVEGEDAARTAFEKKWPDSHGGQAYTAEFMRPYDALMKRRPDLIHIPLTCENTHTALPYIDIVNEILEYYVAFGKLDQDAAHDTGAATTAELLAEPQNVITEAYEVVRQARYPLTLPFDLWLETVRAFANHFETPLADVLEAFRRSDKLFDPAQPFDWTAIFVESLGLSPADFALFTDPDPLAGGKWYGLYGYPTTGPAIANSTNTAPAARLALPNDAVTDADAFAVGSPVTYRHSGSVRGETLTIAVIGAANSGGSGRTLITLSGVWTTPPVAGDELILAAPARLRSAKTLADRLGVSYTDLVEIVKTGFINPKLVELALLYKLGVTVGDAFFYESHKAFYAQNKDLLGVERDDLPPADQARYDALSVRDPATRRTGWEDLDRVRALLDKLAAASQEFAPFEALAWLEGALAAHEFNHVLVLADPDAGCSFDATTLQYADGRAADDIDFLRLNLFVRLWRKLGWTIDEIDRALISFTPGTAPNPPFDTADLGLQPLKTALIYLAHLKALVARLRVGKYARLKLLTLWSDLATTGAKPLYAQLFLTRSVLNSDPVFDHPLGRYLGDETILLKDHVLALQGALGLTADEIGRILTDVALNINTAPLTLANVSHLYRYSLLAKGLKLSVSELIALKKLSNLNPLAPLHAGPLAGLPQDHPFSQTLRFVEVAQEIKDSGLQIEDLEYLLRHRFDPTGKYRTDSAGTVALLKALAEGIRAIRAEHAVPDDRTPLSDETLRQKLGLVLPAEVGARLLAMLNGTTEFTAVTGLASNEALNSATFSGAAAIVGVSYNEARLEQKLTYRGVLFPAQQTALEGQFNTALSPAQQTAFNALLTGVRDQARAFFDKHLQKQAPGSTPAYGFLDADDYDLLFDPDLVLDPPAPAGQEDQERLRRRLRSLAAAFVPFLQANLIRQFILQTLAAKTSAEPVMVESLLTDVRLLGVPAGAPTQPLLNILTATAERGLTVTFFASGDNTGAPLQPPATRTTADTGPLPPGANSARLEGHLEVPESGAYRFFVRLDKANAEATLRFAHLPGPTLTGTASNDGAELGHGPTEFGELKPGTLYRFTLELRKLNGGGARVLVQGETSPKDSLEQLPVYPSQALAGAERALTLLTKALQLLQILELGERETRYVLTHAVDFSDIDLSQLPADETDDTLIGAQKLFGQFLRLAAYARLKRDVAPGADDLIGVFENSRRTYPASAPANIVMAELFDDVCGRFANLTRRPLMMVESVAEQLRFRVQITNQPDGLHASAPDFASEKSLLRLWQALQIVERFGVSVASLASWTGIVGAATTPEQRFTIAHDAKEAIKARFEPEAWQGVAQSIFDRLRQRQRDALVAHVLHTRGFERLEQLYEFFLIDPGMEPVVQTSRIRLAIASVQLFIQRCLLNLEEDVHPAAIVNAGYWEWMKRYRVWEANRKIFLFPENWLEPEFRDDKTHLYRELEGALLQGDVSQDLVEDAFLNYLRKLDELARLDLVAMHLEQRDDPGQNVLHVFGRTFSQPHKYFYRCYAAGRWEPWQPVTAEIDGDHLAPVVWRGRLYLFWVTFTEKPRPNTEPINIPSNGGVVNLPPGPFTDLEAQLNWSEYVKGEWSTRESGGFDTSTTIPLPNLNLTQINQIFIHVNKEYVDGEERGMYIHLSSEGNQKGNQVAALAIMNCPPGDLTGCNDPIDDDGGVFDPGDNPPVGGGGSSPVPPVGSQFYTFYLAGRNSRLVRLTGGEPQPQNPYSAQDRRANRYSGTGSLTVNFPQRITTEPNKAPVKTTLPLPILDVDAKYTLLPCDNLLALEVPESAYKDAKNPDEVKAALKDGLAELESLIKPVFYQDNTHTFFVEPNVAERTVEQWETWVQPTPPPVVFDPTKMHDWQIQHVRPYYPRLGQSIHGLSPTGDWLVNRGTLIRFDEQLIGPQGQVPLTIKPAAEAMPQPGVPVHVNNASAVGAAEVAILGEGLTLDQVGLTQPASGLHVVGGGGVNLALMNNFDRLKLNGSGAGSSGMLDQ